MSIDFIPYSSAYLPAVQRFSEKMYVRPRDDRFLEWRYKECPNQKGVLAMQDGECVAMVWFFVRTYQMRKSSVTCLELMDWATRSDMRGMGLGIRLLKTMMDNSDPIQNLGGSDDTRRFLPQLGWKSLGEVPQFYLPLSAKPILNLIGEKTRIPLNWLNAATDPIFQMTIGLWFKGRPQATDVNLQVEQANAPTAELLQLYDEEIGDRTALVPDLRYLKWLMSAPAKMGRYVLLYFRRNGKLRGWSFSRICSTRLGNLANIIEMYVPPEEESHLVSVVSQTVNVLAPFKPDGVCAGATHLVYQDSLRKNRFFQRGTWPMFYWSPDGSELPMPIVLGNQTSDLALLPYPPE
jgi:hypothetical protein